MSRLILVLGDQLTREVAALREYRDGDTVVILEAMKMENALASPGLGSVKAFPFPEGATVKKGDVLAIITP